ncbi:MAG: DJ-1 family glyoxalase III [Verrucomicrobiota bacterium]
MSISVGIFLAPGFEEIEAITAIDILRRASMTVTSIGTVNGPLTASRQTVHLADCGIEEALEKSWDLLILPGGVEGTKNLLNDERVQKRVRHHAQQGKWIASLCAAPTVLDAWGILEGKTFTAHPSVQKTIKTEGLRGSERVVVSGRLITSLAAGSAMEFAYEIVRQLMGEEAVRQVEQGVYSGLV